MNLFPEIVPKGEGKEVAGFFSAPGLTTPLVTAGNGPIRGGIILGNNLYIVSGPSIYQIDLSFNATLLGAMTTNAGPISAIANPTQILFSDGVVGQMYDTSTTTLSSVASFPIGGQLLTYADGYGFTNVPGTSYFYRSDLDNLGNWDLSNRGNPFSTSDNITSLISIHREIWLFKRDASEVWINTQGSGFGYSRLEGVFLEAGCIAPFSVCVVGEDIIWLGQNNQGAGVIYQSKGYSYIRRSTHAIEAAWQSYSDITNAISYAYQQEGHEFYVITFPSGDVTWVLDLTTGYWHERASMDTNGQLHRHQSNFHAYFSGKHVVGDYQTGALYQLDLNTYTDNGTAKKWIRTWRAFHQGQQPYEDVTFDSLQIDMQKGILVPDGTSPQMSLRWSNDGGHTWSYEMSASVGKTGETAGTVRFRRLGSTSQSKGRDRVFELSSSDVYPTALIGADMDASRA